MRREPKSLDMLLLDTEDKLLDARKEVRRLRAWIRGWPKRWVMPQEWMDEADGALAGKPAPKVKR